MTTSIGVDVGGTKISAAYIVGQEIVASQKRVYNRSRVVEDIAELYQELVSSREPASTIGVSCAGLIDSSSGIVRFAGNLDMNQFPLGPELEKSLGIPVIVENDARCAIWGEFSKAQGSLGSNVAGLVLGTGVGGGLIIDSKLFSGKNGFAGEFGHLPVTNSKRKCACGLIGCLESIAGGRAFEEAYKANFGESLSGEQLAERARASDASALEAFEEVGNSIGQVIALLDNALDLDALVIGGGFGATSDIWLETATASYLKSLVGSGRREPLRIIGSQLGPNAQLFGAGSLR
jgi:glucokinase